MFSKIAKEAFEKAYKVYMETEPDMNGSDLKKAATIIQDAMAAYHKHMTDSRTKLGSSPANTTARCIVEALARYKCFNAGASTDTLAQTIEEVLVDAEDPKRLAFESMMGALEMEQRFAPDVRHKMFESFCAGWNRRELLCENTKAS